MKNLQQKRCLPCEGGVLPLSEAEIEGFMTQLNDWSRSGPEITKTFHFKNYYKTMAFVNAVAWMAHQQGHHPDLEVSYDKCQVRYSTHAIGGLSENDFICAAKVDALLA